MSLSIAPVGRLRTGERVTAKAGAFVAGSTVTWFGEFRDPVSAALTSPTAVEFQFLSPADVAIAEPGILVSTGVYGASLAFDVAGNWTARLFANGVRLDERVFGVVASAIDPDATLYVVAPTQFDFSHPNNAVLLAI